MRAPREEFTGEGGATSTAGGTGKQVYVHTQSIVYACAPACLHTIICTPNRGPTMGQKEPKRGPRGPRGGLRRLPRRPGESQESLETAPEESGRFREDVPSATADTDQVWSGCPLPGRPT
eukprot:9453181-Pyramimonas_sp.AAC.1